MADTTWEASGWVWIRKHTRSVPDIIHGLKPHNILQGAQKGRDTICPTPPIIRAPPLPLAGTCVRVRGTDEIYAQGFSSHEHRPTQGVRNG